ncbi:MAG: asparagine synthase (glutamine-hydrolyzing) [Bacteroidia bacterium]|nr:asparagine synthase (glutamine-hydrolyzing) [Bacteroidia bacterium]MCZ2277466.1 asparagine synthase (glutamine-hydrolyzing) [Bacteroidia bacterium]
MCGISGIVSFSKNSEPQQYNIDQAVDSLSLRGPDARGIYSFKNVVFGHRRLSVIDLSDAGKQPMTDQSGRFTIILNGEFFNFKQYRELVLAKGFNLTSDSDTEVLLYLYIMEKEKCLERINGFFALAIFDNENQELFLARDRYGVKPLVYYLDENQFVFASEIKSLLKFKLDLTLDKASLLSFFQLNYFQPPYSVFKEIRKLRPGHFMKFSTHSISAVSEKQWYSIPREEHPEINYQQALKHLEKLTEEAVQRRMISDVPLGCFLSGGWDSSIITALAARYKPNLKTFSIGFKDEPEFDETEYAHAVANMHQTEHTTFSLTNDDLFEILFDVLNYMDEPFADSSALNVYILSQHTRREVTVALSGDGADELFLGYNKHRAEWIVRNQPLLTSSMRLLSPVLKHFSGSREGKSANQLRQFNRFVSGARLNAANRYWRWCSLMDEAEAFSFIRHSETEKIHYQQRRTEILKILEGTKNMNDVFCADFNLVLTGDMLIKADSMTMANSLEVRCPFLDFELVNFVSGLPSSYKIDNRSQKKILKDTFRHLVPNSVKTRKKHGFEVPLLKWFRTGLKPLIDELLDRNFISGQNIFDPEETEKLRQQINTAYPGEAVARIWALIVFQYWWKRHHSFLKS